MILIADDDADLAENCSMMLEAHGYDVSVVSNATEALAKIAEQAPELLISDCCMPGMSGPQLCDELEARPSGKDFPILLMSGSMKCEVAPQTSYDAFLRKPFMAEELMTEVRRLLQDSRPLSAHAGLT